MRRAVLAVVSTVAALVMLLSFKTHSASTSRPAAIGAANPGTGSGSTGGDTGSTSTPSTSPSTSSSGSSSGSSSSAAGGSSSAKTFTGDSTDTQWGPVQVEITVKS